MNTQHDEFTNLLINVLTAPLQVMKIQQELEAEQYHEWKICFHAYTTFMMEEHANFRNHVEYKIASDRFYAAREKFENKWHFKFDAYDPHFTQMHNDEVKRLNEEHRARIRAGA